MHRLPPLAALLATLLLPLTASALTIDDFSGSTQSVTDSVVGFPAVSSEEAHSVLGGSRYVHAFQSGGVGSMTTSAGGGTGSFSHTGDGFGFGYGVITYDGVVDGTNISRGLNVDLTQGGIVNRFQSRFQIDVLSVSGGVTLTVTARSGDIQSQSVSFDVPTPGTYEVFFNAFGYIDFTDISALSLGPEVSLDGNDNVVLNSFSVVVVPEPSTALLFAAGLAALAVRRRSARAS